VTSGGVPGPVVWTGSHTAAASSSALAAPAGAGEVAVRVLRGGLNRFRQ